MATSDRCLLDLLTRKQRSEQPGLTLAAAADKLARVEPLRQEARDWQQRQDCLHMACRARRPGAPALLQAGAGNLQTLASQLLHLQPVLQRTSYLTQAKGDKPQVTLQGHSGHLQAVCWDPSHDDNVASAANDHTVRCAACLSCVTILLLVVGGRWRTPFLWL